MEITSDEKLGESFLALYLVSVSIEVQLSVLQIMMEHVEIIQFGLCVLFEEGENQLASLTGFRWNTFVAWMQGVASLWETTLKLCWRANKASEKESPSGSTSHA